MKVSIAYANSETQLWHQVVVPDKATVSDVINRSGILELIPELDINQQKIGIFGKFVKLTAAVKEGDRIEIYHPITRVLDEDDDDDDD